MMPCSSELPAEGVAIAERPPYSPNCQQLIHLLPHLLLSFVSPYKTIISFPKLSRHSSTSMDIIMYCVILDKINIKHSPQVTMWKEGKHTDQRKAEQLRSPRTPVSTRWGSELFPGHHCSRQPMYR